VIERRAWLCDCGRRPQAQRPWTPASNLEDRTLQNLVRNHSRHFDLDLGTIFDQRGHLVTSPIVFTALKSDWVRHRIFRIAVHDERTLNPHILAEWVTPHTASGERWQRLRRFFRWQLDKEHNSVTQSAVPSMRRFDKATLLVWGEQDTNFGPVLAKRLAQDIPGTAGIVWMKNSAHMPMIEEPQAYADAVLAFMKIKPDAAQR
jgi:pimeloyl-ACP methyl ester carboxylesterase